MFLCLFFFFKHKTAYEMRISDWSADVCSSDLTRLRSVPSSQAPRSAAHETSAATLNDLLRGRFSCRAYRPEPVPRETIERILAMAQRTASWRNGRPGQVAITSGAGTERFRGAMYAHAQSGADDESDLPRPREYRGVYALRRLESGLALYRQLGILKGDHEGSELQALENFRHFGAPHVAIVTTDEALDVYGAVDCGGYVE